MKSMPEKKRIARRDPIGCTWPGRRHVPPGRVAAFGLAEHMGWTTDLTTAGLEAFFGTHSMLAIAYKQMAYQLSTLGGDSVNLSTSETGG